MPKFADYRVRIVADSGKADVKVVVVNAVAVDLTDGDAGDVLTIQPDGSIAADPIPAPPAASVGSPTIIQAGETFTVPSRQGVIHAWEVVMEEGATVFLTDDSSLIVQL